MVKTQISVSSAKLRSNFCVSSRFLSCWVCLYTWFIAVQLPDHVRLFATPWTAALQASVPPHLPKFAQVRVQDIDMVYIFYLTKAS